MKIKLHGGPADGQTFDESIDTHEVIYADTPLRRYDAAVEDPESPVTITYHRYVRRASSSNAYDYVP